MSAPEPAGARALARALAARRSSAVDAAREMPYRLTPATRCARDAQPNHRRYEPMNAPTLADVAQRLRMSTGEAGVLRDVEPGGLALVEVVENVTAREREMYGAPWKAVPLHDVAHADSEAAAQTRARYGR